jgi:hypothetical protein
MVMPYRTQVSLSPGCSAEGALGVMLRMKPCVQEGYAGKSRNCGVGV